MSPAVRSLLTRVRRYGALLPFRMAERLNEKDRKALSEAQSSGFVERTAMGFALNAYGRAELRRAS